MVFRGIGIMARFVGLNSCLWNFILSEIWFLRSWRVVWGLRRGGKGRLAADLEAVEEGFGNAFDGDVSYGRQRRAVMAPGDELF
jgi:hypothetical protein